jgi:CRISPR-associated protein Csd2
MTPTDNVITNRYDFVYLFDVASGNPNGDPDAGNQPRIDPETGEGLVTDVCLKRKVRNFVTIAKRPNGEPEAGYDIYVKERGILANEQRRAYQALGLEPGDRPNERARQWMCQQFYDVRAFGAVMTTGKTEEGQDRKGRGKGAEKTEEQPASAKEPGEAKGAKKKPRQWNCGQVRGPVQLTFARSILPILSLEHAITRCALTNATDTGREAGEEGEKAVSGQMGRKNTVPYGLYRAHGFVSPHHAADTGFTESDLQLLWRALVSMFEHDRSATRGQMAARGLVVFKHESPLGNAPAHVLFDRIAVERRHGVAVPRKYGDFAVSVNDTDLPNGVRLLRFDCDSLADPVPFVVVTDR